MAYHARLTEYRVPTFHNTSLSINFTRFPFPHYQLINHKSKVFSIKLFTTIMVYTTA